MSRSQRAWCVVIEQYLCARICSLGASPAHSGRAAENCIEGFLPVSDRAFTLAALSLFRDSARGQQHLNRFRRHPYSAVCSSACRNFQDFSVSDAVRRS